MNGVLIVLVSLISCVLSNVISGARKVFPLKVEDGEKYWPSIGKAEGDFSGSPKDELDIMERKYINSSISIPADKAFILDSKFQFLYGTIELEKVDIQIQVLDPEYKKKEWYVPLDQWGNGSVTDKQITEAMDSAFASRVLLRSVSVGSAKAAGTGFESVGPVNDVVYAQTWKGTFGGLFNGNAHLSFDKLNKQSILQLFNISMVKVEGQIVRVVTEKARFNLEVSYVTGILGNGTISKGPLVLEGLESNAVPNNGRFLTILVVIFGILLVGGVLIYFYRRKRVSK
ncbi:hypothetical protein BC833DRAFT_606430 [Globomyces pollinis-pini]|nr:hypothetical protein BC833DRAFT_606430 [Globomyces pollinis-pini]